MSVKFARLLGVRLLGSSVSGHAQHLDIVGGAVELRGKTARLTLGGGGSVVTRSTVALVGGEAVVTLPSALEAHVTVWEVRGDARYRAHPNVIQEGNQLRLVAVRDMAVVVVAVQ